MERFLGEDYLLSSAESRGLFDQIGAFPIVDAHNHVEAEQIATDRGWSDIWEVEGATDHYVWELMRRCGVPEDLITGTASNREKWNAFAKIVPRIAGNPLYEWFHLDLRRRFGIVDLVSSDTASAIWERTKEALASPQLRPRSLLQEMKVEVLCTTDSPLSDLRWHERLRDELSFPRVLPTWRPDLVCEIESPKWKEFIAALGEKTDEDTEKLSGLLVALEKTHHHFRAHGGVASDHGIDVPYGEPASSNKAEKLYRAAVAGSVPVGRDLRALKSFFLHYFAELDAEAGWTMQLHIGAVRNYRVQVFRTMGKDSGGDVASHTVEIAAGLHHFLNAFDGKLNVVLYAIHPSHIYTLVTLVRAFPNASVGSPWWFMDNPFHIRDQLLQVASVDLLSNYAGMVTDSRKLFSFQSRTEVFRRVLADVLGEMVRAGRVPIEVAGEVGAAVAYHRPKELFFKKETK